MGYVELLAQLSPSLALTLSHPSCIRFVDTPSQPRYARANSPDGGGVGVPY
jgi:hypothetical protein